MTKTKSAIIFGVNGQDGFYLTQILQQAGIAVIGVSRTSSNFLLGNVTDFNFVSGLIKTYQPTFIFHLAANSTTRHDATFENYHTISTGTLNILESVYNYSKHSKVFISGSGLQFVNKNMPIQETDPFEGRDSYSVARIQSVYTSRYYRSMGVQVYVGYFFNHDSPLRSERHINQKIIIAAKAIASGAQTTLSIGDYTVEKEFAFAGDIACAIWTLVNNNDVFEVVIGSGKAYPISAWLAYCFGYYGLDWQKHVVIDSNFSPEYKILVSNPHTIKALGWEPKVEIHDLAQMMIDSHQ